ncbi:MAG: hypothetical protein ACE5G2_10115 [Candidatus Krumholzibacteriia bacterium]
MGTLASDLGLPPNTLTRWCSAAARVLEQVEIVPRPPESAPGPVLVSASGHRVEGLTVEDLAILLGRLS